MKFLDVKTDFAFKKVFGSEGSKDILMSFLNSLVLFSENEVIEDLTIVDPYQIPLIKGMKDTYVDVKAKLSNGSTVIIEMQILNVQGMEQRILYNAAKAYSTQLVPGERYHLLNPVIALTITDFVMFADTVECMSTFRLTEKERLVEYNGDIELIFIELPKFTKTEEELDDITDKWLYFIKNAGSLAYIPETLSLLPELSHAFSIANEAGLSLEEQEAQWKRKDFIMLQKGSIELAEKKGREEGKEERNIEIALEMIKDCETNEKIIKYTGLSDDEIEKLRGDYL
jgi:predicted transposase/invertase (TIGR01784 family)